MRVKGKKTVTKGRRERERREIGVKNCQKRMRKIGAHGRQKC